MTTCFGCGKEIEGKPYLDKDKKRRFQDKPIIDKQGQPNCLLCMMYAIGMEYRKIWLEEADKAKQ